MGAELRVWHVPSEKLIGVSHKRVSFFQQINDKEYKESNENHHDPCCCLPEILLRIAKLPLARRERLPLLPPASDLPCDVGPNRTRQRAVEDQRRDGLHRLTCSASKATL
jgi:hypothetical protein